MTWLVLGLILFLGVHSVRIVADDWRTGQLARLGEKKWKGVYSLASLTGFLLLLWGFGQARHDTVVLWNPPLWTHYVAAPLVLLSFVLIAAAYVPGTRIKAWVGHPMVAGVKTWAFAHLIANGTLADVVFFGSIFVWAIVDFASSRRRDRAAGTVYPAGTLARDARAVVIGVVAWAVLTFYAHRWLFGVSPLG